MTNWIRKGKLFDRYSYDISWLKLNVQLPIPYLLSPNRLRLYVTFCDEFNRGRLGYIDVDPDNPNDVLGYSREPLLDLGKKGYFDENGVVATSVLKDDGKVYVYYCGFQKHINYPYSSLAGVAVSRDGGESFERVKETPLLERTEGEMFIRTGVGIYKYGETYRLYYASGNEWIDIDDKQVPKYSLKYLESDSPIDFEGKGMELFPLKNDEYGMTSPQIIRNKKGYGMVYSIRSVSEGYKMGYAYSEEGTRFRRMNGVMDIDRPEGEFDSQMMCYGKVYIHHNRVYLFYSGNHYGMDGIGWAELKNDKYCNTLF